MTNYGSAIGGIIGTAMILNTLNKITGKHIIKGNTKLFPKIKLKGGYVKKRK